MHVSKDDSDCRSSPAVLDAPNALVESRTSNPESLARTPLPAPWRPRAEAPCPRKRDPDGARLLAVPFRDVQATHGRRVVVVASLGSVEQRLEIQLQIRRVLCRRLAIHALGALCLHLLSSKRFHDSAPPSLRRVARVAVPASSALRGAPTPHRPSHLAPIASSLGSTVAHRDGIGGVSQVPGEPLRSCPALRPRWNRRALTYEDDRLAARWKRTRITVG